MEDEESERASLVSRRSSRSRRSGVVRTKPDSQGPGFFSRLFGRPDRASYQPIQGDE